MDPKGFRERARAAPRSRAPAYGLLLREPRRVSGVDRGGRGAKAADARGAGVVYGHRPAQRRAGPARAVSGAGRHGHRVRAHRPRARGRDPGAAGQRHLDAARHHARKRRRQRRHGRAPARGALRPRHRQRPRRGRRPRAAGDGRQRRVLRLPDPQRGRLRAARAARGAARARADRGRRGRPAHPHRARARLADLATRSTSRTRRSGARSCGSTRLDPTRFEREIASARTFGFLHDVRALWNAGLAQGGSLRNTVLLDDTRVLNPDGLRWPDEFVRHKVLDLLGDLALLGVSIDGHVKVECGGHALHHRLVAALLERPRAWRLREAGARRAPDLAPLLSPAVASLLAARASRSLRALALQRSRARSGISPSSSSASSRASRADAARSVNSMPMPEAWPPGLPGRRAHTTRPSISCVSSLSGSRKRSLSGVPSRCGDSVSMKRPPAPSVVAGSQHSPASHRYSTNTRSVRRRKRRVVSRATVRRGMLGCLSAAPRTARASRGAWPRRSFRDPVEPAAHRASAAASAPRRARRRAASDRRHRPAGGRRRRGVVRHAGEQRDAQIAAGFVEHAGRRERAHLREPGRRNRAP